MTGPDVQPAAATKSSPRRRLARIAWRIVRLSLAAYLVILLAMMIIENSMVYFPAPYPAGDWQPWGLEFEDAQFRASDGIRLHGWYVPHPDPRGFVLYAHGNAGNLSGRADILRSLHREAGVAVLIFDYRGYGKSEGSPSETGVLDDARSARAWLAERAGVAPREIVLMGRSLGGGVAVDLAARDGARGLILESTFTSLPDVAQAHYPWLPVRLLMRNRFDSAAKIGDYHGPLLQSHGTADQIIPYSYGRALFDKAHQPKQFIDLPGAGHNDLQPAEYYGALAEFIGDLPAVQR